MWIWELNLLAWMVTLMKRLDACEISLFICFKSIMTNSTAMVLNSLVQISGLSLDFNFITCKVERIMLPTL